MAPILPPAILGSPAESPPSLSEANTPTPEAGDALIYTHLHLIYSNTGEALANSADRKTPPTLTLPSDSPPGRNRGLGDQSPLEGWKLRGKLALSALALHLVHFERANWFEFPASPPFPSSPLLHSKHGGWGQGLRAAHSLHPLFHSIWVPGQGTANSPSSQGPPSQGTQQAPSSSGPESSLAAALLGPCLGDL